VTGLDWLDARDYVEWRIASLAACLSGQPAPPLPQPAYVQSPVAEQQPSEAALYVEQQVKACLAARVVVEAVGRG
jgi:hypothetical protein